MLSLGATVLAGVSFWAVLVMALCSSTSRYVTTRQNSLLSTYVKPVGFLLLGSLDIVLCHLGTHGISLWILKKLEAFADMWGLGKVIVSGVSALIQECESSCVENWTGSNIKLVFLYRVWKSLCYWEIDAAVWISAVFILKLPCLENKTSHEMEGNKMNLSVPCLKEMGKDFAGELTLSCS